MPSVMPDPGQIFLTEVEPIPRDGRYHTTSRKRFKLHTSEADAYAAFRLKTDARIFALGQNDETGEPEWWEIDAKGHFDG